MTTIIGLTTTDGVYLAGDRKAVSSFMYATKAAPKVAKLGPIVIGASGEPRAFDLVCANLDYQTGYNLEADPHNKILGLVEAIAGLLKQAEIEECPSWLIGYQGMLWGVDKNFNTIRPDSGLWAIGSGQEAALGAMMALEGAHDHPTKRLAAAMQIVSQIDPYTGGPFDIVFAPKETPADD